MTKRTAKVSDRQMNALRTAVGCGQVYSSAFRLSTLQSLAERGLLAFKCTSTSTSGRLHAYTITDAGRALVAGKV